LLTMASPSCVGTAIGGLIILIAMLPLLN
jgi:hypothetical protein